MSDVGGPQNVSNASFTISNAGATAIGNSNGAWTLYMHDDGNKDFGGLASWSLIITTDESTAALVGTPDDDVIFVTTPMRLPARASSRSTNGAASLTPASTISPRCRAPATT
jgi:subtilisin-like proprotein convertase family protein